VNFGYTGKTGGRYKPKGVPEIRPVKSRDGRTLVVRGSDVTRIVVGAGRVSK
jgi:hypothetical protein